MASIRLRGREDLTRVAAALDNAPNNLRRELVAALKTAARPAVRDIKAAIRGADVSGRRTGRGRPFRAVVPSLGLRGPMARAVDSQVSTRGDGAGADIVFKTERVPVRTQRLVKYVVGDSKRWRHPIMGKNPDGSWRGAASQNAPNVWWKTLRPHLPRFNREVAAAVERTAQQLQREAG